MATQTHTAIGYVRVSTTEQVDNGVSLEAQSEAIRSYCSMRGIELIEIVVDAGVTAAKPLSSRDGGSRVLCTIKKRLVDAVVTYKLDRLFRNASDCLAVTSDWDKADIGLHLIDMGGQSVDTSTAMGRFFMTMLAGVAEMERNLIAERTRAALKHKQNKGELTGKAPIGMRVGDDGIHLEEDKQEQQAVESILQWRRDGVSFRKIVARLNTEAVPCRGSKWHLASVQRVLARYTQQ